MTTTPDLSTARASALYIGALLGPSLLLLPGLAAGLAGPASILAWLVLLTVSALLARLFTVLGIRLPSSGGVAAYAAAGLGRRAGRAAGWCFLAGAVCGAPVVCLIGGSYVGVLLGGSRTVGLISAVVLLIAVLALTLGGARATAAAQLVLVGLLVVLIAVAVIGSAPAAHTANWTPFAPHGWARVGSATAVLMMSAVGWEAIAPLTAKLRDPARQLPRVILIAFTVTTILYLALATATVAVLGPAAGSAVPISDLLRVALGAAGPAVAAVAAVALTLAATNAYLTGAVALATSLRSPQAQQGGRESRQLQVGTGAVGLLVLGGAASGLVSTVQLVTLPTALFLSVYLACGLAGTRLFSGGDRLIAVLTTCAVAGIMCFAGRALIGVLVVAVVAALTPLPGTRRTAGRSEAEKTEKAENELDLTLTAS
jgi:amino acid efflux transporter